MKGRRPNPLHSYDPLLCQEIESRTDAAVQRAVKGWPALEKSKFVGPFLKLLVYSHLDTSDENKIALGASAAKEMIDAIMPADALPNLGRLMPKPSEPMAE